MTEQEKREKVIKGLECCLGDTRADLPNLCTICPYAHGSYATQTCGKKLREDALALLKRSFTPQEVYDTVIEHAQHDKRFKLGDKIDYSFTDAVDILNIEMMCKAGDM